METERNVLRILIVVGLVAFAIAAIQGSGWMYIIPLFMGAVAWLVNETSYVANSSARWEKLQRVQYSQQYSRQYPPQYQYMQYPQSLQIGQSGQRPAPSGFGQNYYGVAVPVATVAKAGVKKPRRAKSRRSK